MSVPTHAWVIFRDEGRKSMLAPFLRRGFRHCFVIWQGADDLWMTFDSMGHRVEIQVHPHLARDFDLPGWHLAQGLVVVPSKVHQVQGEAPFGILSCVENVKRFLGIQDMAVQTPFQLYRHLTNKPC